MAEIKQCLCQCGGTTKGGSFLPGHDARYKSFLVKEAMAGGNPDAERILEERGWTKFLDKAKEIAARPKVERRPAKPKADEDGLDSLDKLHLLKAGAKVLKRTNQYSKSVGPRRIELDYAAIEELVTLTDSRLEPPDDQWPGPHADLVDMTRYFDWSPGEEAAVAKRLRLVPGAPT